MKLKRIKLIVSILIVILIINIIGLIYLINLRKANTELKNKNQVDMVLIETRIYPSNFSEFHLGYKGEVKKDNLYEYLHKLINTEIPKLNKIELNKVQEYFNTNKKEISLSLGISKVEDFYNLVKQIKALNKEEFVYENSEIDMSTYRTNKDYVEFNLSVKYKDTKEFTIKVYFSNKSNIKPVVKINTI